MEKRYCKQCKYYLQHFTFVEERMIQVNCGHCTNPTAKRKRPDADACELFALGTFHEETFVSRKFLTKTLLEHVLNMELLPPIEDATGSEIK